MSVRLSRPAKHKICASTIILNAGLHSWLWILSGYGFWLSAHATPFYSCSIVWMWSSHWHRRLLCAAAWPAGSRDIDCRVTAWKLRSPFSRYSVFPWQGSEGTYLETNVRAGRIVPHLKSVLRHHWATRQQYFVIFKLRSKHLIMNILLAWAVHYN